jgi:hypothetical protein
MRKPKSKKGDFSDEMLAEYDFRGGIRGKYTQAYSGRGQVLELPPDLAEAFPTPEAVIKALRACLELTKSIEKSR